LRQIQSDPNDHLIAFLDGQLIATTLPAALHHSWQPPTPEAVPQRINVGLENYLATTITIPQINHPSFQLVLLESLVTLQKTQQRGWILIGTFAIVGGAIAIAAGTVVTRFISDRIHILTDHTQELATGHLSQKITMDGNDEITTLARGFNFMSEQLQSRDEKLTRQMQELENTLKKLQQTQTQLIQTEKMSGLGQMVAGVAHEINNPLSFIYGNVTYAKDYITDLLILINLYQQKYPNPDPEIDAAIEEMELDFLVEDLPHLLDSMQDGADRIRQIVLSLRNFSRMDEADMKQVDIHQGLDSTLVILRNRLTEKSSAKIEVIKNYGELPLVECYASQLNQVFMNLLGNAIDALNAWEKFDADNQPKITISTEIQLMNPQRETKDAQEKSIQSDQSVVVIKIADNGPGMPEKVKQRIFDPFFTTKPVGKGTGLGLSISYQIIAEKHHGILECLSEPGQGTTF
jgi:two-component system NtrC family sensor kinase